MRLCDHSGPPVSVRTTPELTGLGNADRRSVPTTIAIMTPSTPNIAPAINGAALRRHGRSVGAGDGWQRQPAELGGPQWLTLRPGPEVAANSGDNTASEEGLTCRRTRRLGRPVGDDDELSCRADVIRHGAETY